MTAIRTRRSDLPDVPVGGVTLPGLVLAQAGRLRDKPALVDGATGRAISYGELAAGVERVSAGLAARGFAPGDVLAVYSPNVPEYAVAAYGAMVAGGTVTGANPMLTADELAGQLVDSGARILVTVPPLLERARAAAEKAGGVEVLGYAELDAGEYPPVRVTIDPATALAALPYSSGTTGLPKGVELTHSSMVTNVRQGRAVLGPEEDDVVLAVAPFFHAMGFGLVLPAALAAGATLVTMARFDLEQMLRTIQDHQVTYTVVVPPIAQALAGHPLVDEFDLSSLRTLGVGAAPLGADHELRCAQRLGCRTGQGLGMTETAALIAAGPLDAPRRGSVGRLIPNTEARIVDPDSGADLAAGRAGELLVRGPQLMRGYRDRPAATAATVDADGWLHTGDLCFFDEDGYLYVTDRLKELIKYKGYQVAPAELERLLLTHPAVADAAVVPRPDPDAGEVPVGYVVLRGTATAAELLAYVAERVAPYKRLRAVRITEAVPRSPAGKLLRRVLVEAERGAAW
ncbi:AMP-binding protein [Actinoplanes sp. NPDC049668]|uniref:AMP-binding protein n=1 Tax=unclassified Actinoplanes TaxID=2626549 RepID=UPI0033A5969C